jgi:hypothetical protein
VRRRSEEEEAEGRRQVAGVGRRKEGGEGRRQEEAGKRRQGGGRTQEESGAGRREGGGMRQEKEEENMPLFTLVSLNSILNPSSFQTMQDSRNNPQDPYLRLNYSPNSQIPLFFSLHSQQYFH